MKYTWTSKFIKEIAKENRKKDHNEIWKVCMTLACYNKDEAVNLYSLIREELAK
jgi:hypothetical protein